VAQLAIRFIGYDRVPVIIGGLTHAWVGVGILQWSCNSNYTWFEATRSNSMYGHYYQYFSWQNMTQVTGFKVYNSHL